MMISPNSGLFFGNHSSGKAKPLICKAYFIAFNFPWWTEKVFQFGWPNSILNGDILGFELAVLCNIVENLEGRQQLLLYALPEILHGGPLTLTVLKAVRLRETITFT